MKKQLIFLLAAILIFPCFAMTVSAESTNYNANLPYYSYTYDEADETVQIPAPYSASEVLSGKDFGVQDFEILSDVFYDEEAERIYLTDKGSSRIVVLDQELQLIKEISGFDNEGVQDKFNKPGSVCVRDGKVYVADTENARIVILNATSYELERVLNRPDIKLLDDNYVYAPNRLAVDLAGRIYVIANNINDGILLLDQEGEFVRFVAAPDVTLNLWTKFLKTFMTKAQKAQLEKSVPTEYSSFLMDEKGFLYLTSSDSTVHPITKLNSQGTDILKYEDDRYPVGDAVHRLKRGSVVLSKFMDIAVREDGIYAALDTTMGRVFVYDSDGELLYCFGGIGSQEGTFYSPSSVEIFGDKILVTDNFYGNLTVFTRTEFGTTVNTAIVQMKNGEYEAAKKSFEEVLRMAPDYELANLEFAKIDIQNGEYKSALERLEGSQDFSYYSKAFKGYRKQLLRENFNAIVIGLVVLVAVLIAWKYLKKRWQVKEKLNKSKLYREYHYSNHVMFHPFDGFWDLKWEKRGSLAAANILVILFVITYGLRAQFSGYLFAKRLPGEINALYEVAKIVVPLGLCIISNWCFTTLMDGKGKMKDIYIAVAYALKPYIITSIPLLLLSHCLTQDEAFIYTAVDSVVMVWMLALIFFGIMITHDYSLSKGIITAILTILGMCLICFIALTFTNIIEQIYAFISDLYLEMSYRLL